MTDFNSSLPVRTENDGDLVVKVADSTTPSQQLAVDSGGRVTTKVSDGTDELAINADGSLNITDNGGSLTVDATNLDIRDLSAAQDNVAISDGSDTLAINADGSINSVVTATDLDIRNLSASQDNVAISDGTNTAAVTASNELKVLSTAQPGVDIGDVTINNGSGGAAVNIQDGGNSITVDATNLDIRDLSHTQDSVKIGDGTDFLAVNTDGSINVVISDGTPGTPVNDYSTAAAVGAGANSVHTYTAASDFYLTQIEASASGKMKIEVTVNGSTKFVQFNSTSSPNMTITLTQPPLITSGQTITIIRTNKDNQSQDLYSTISGYTL